MKRIVLLLMLAIFVFTACSEDVDVLPLESEETVSQTFKSSETQTQEEIIQTPQPVSNKEKAIQNLNMRELEFYEDEPYSAMLSEIDLQNNINEILETDEVMLSNAVSYKLENFEYINAVNAKCDLIIKSGDNTLIIPTYVKLEYSIDYSTSPRTLEDVKVFFGSVDIINNEILVTDFFDITAYNINTLEEKGIVFSVDINERPKTFLLKPVKTDFGTVVFTQIMRDGHYNGFIRAFHIGSEFNVIKTEDVNFEKFNDGRFWVIEDVNVYGEYIVLKSSVKGDMWESSEFIYPVSSKDILSQLNPDEYYDGEFPKVFAGSNPIYSQDSRYIMIEYSHLSGGDANSYALSVLDTKTGVNTHIGHAGYMYGQGPSYGFFSNGDAYIMDNYSFSIYLKDNNFIKNLELKDTLSLREYFIEDEEYARAIHGLRRDPYSKEFIVVYSEVPASKIYDYMDYPFVEELSYTYTPQSLSIIKTAVIHSGANAIDENYIIAYLDANGNIQESYKVEIPVLLCTFGSPADIQLKLLDTENLALTGIDITGKKVMTAMVNLNQRACTSLELNYYTSDE